ncbi:PLP-dependent transferase [Glonium stellatum]|uniref:PLP-dependent transferase n=1 Tax=Glonium stellatum TaxID=574774 RepID=A0A8E2JMG3_9PEZI|nr:PLP-dependent transferase [Glonium stellatum]
MASTTLPMREKYTLTESGGAGEERGKIRFGREMRKQFLFDEKYLNLNHGSFGTYPKPIRDVMRQIQDQTEARPDAFIRYTYKELLDESRGAMSTMLNVPVDTLVFVPNATTGINTVLRNLVFEPGDKIMYFATIYGSCEKTVEYITETTPAKAVKVQYTYPVSDDWLVDEFTKKVREEKEAGNKIRIAIFDTVVSMPGVRMPFERLTQVCKEEGVLSCVDAAHGVGHIDMDLGKLDPDFLVTNCHKWLFVPRGCALFYVPVRNQYLLRSTLPTSHGFIPTPRPGQQITNPLPASIKSPFVTNFEFVGTIDNSPYLCIPAALKFRESIGGEEVIRDYCMSLVCTAGKLAAEAFGTEVLENEERTLGNCCFSNFKLPLKLESVQAVVKKLGGKEVGVESVVRDWMSLKMVEEYNTFLAIFFYGNSWWVRFSGQIYLELADFEWAIDVLKTLCDRTLEGEFLK